MDFHGILSKDSHHNLTGFFENSFFFENSECMSMLAVNRKGTFSRTLNKAAFSKTESKSTWVTSPV